MKITNRNKLSFWCPSHLVSLS